MSEDKNIEPSDTPTGDAADKWIRANSEEVDPKERIKQLYSLGDQVADIAQKIDWKNRDYEGEIRRKSPTVNIHTVTNEGDGKVELVTLDLKVPEIAQLAGITSQDAELQIDGREIGYISFYNKDFYFLDWAKQYFRDKPTLGISFGDVSGEYRYTYAFTNEGECVKRSSKFTKGEDVIRDEGTQNLTPDEINKVDVGMRMLKSNLGEFSLAGR